MALSGEELIFNLALGLIGEQEIEDTAASRLLKQYRFCNRYFDQARDKTLRSHPWNEAKKRTIIVQNDDEPIFGYDRTYNKPSDSLRILLVNDSVGADTRYNASSIDAWEPESELILANSGETPQTWATNTKYVDGEFVSETAVNWVTGTAFVKDQFVRDGGLVYQVLVSHTSDTISNDVTAGNLAAGIQGSTGTYEVLVSHISDTTLADVASGNIEAKASEARIIFVEYIFKLTDTTKFSANLEEAISVQLAIKVITGLTNDTKGKIDLINEFERLTMPQARSVDGAEGKPKRYFNSSWIRSRSFGTIGRRW